MAKIIHIAILIENKDADNIYPKLRDQLNEMPVVKDYSFNGRWKDYQVSDNYQSGDFIRALQEM